jgi:hypothetical protein
MPRLHLNWITVDEQQVADRAGPLTVPHTRLTALLYLADSHKPCDGLVDVGAPLSIVPESIWREFAADIEWLAVPPHAETRSWIRTVSGYTGGSIPCRLGRVSVRFFDLHGALLPATPIVAKFASDNGTLPRRLLLGLWGGILSGRKLVVDDTLRQAWLETP